MNQEEKKVPAHAHRENCSLCEVRFWHPGRRAPWVSRVFDAMGLVFIATSFVIFFIAWMTDDTKFYIALSVSFFISGLLYTAAGELLRSCAETAVNTARLLELKEIELAEHKLIEKN